WSRLPRPCERVAPRRDFPRRTRRTLQGASTRPERRNASSLCLCVPHLAAGRKREVECERLARLDDDHVELVFVIRIFELEMAFPARKRNGKRGRRGEEMLSIDPNMRPRIDVEDQPAAILEREGRRFRLRWEECIERQPTVELLNPKARDDGDGEHKDHHEHDLGDQPTIARSKRLRPHIVRAAEIEDIARLFLGDDPDVVEIVHEMTGVIAADFSREDLDEIFDEPLRIGVAMRRHLREASCDDALERPWNRRVELPQRRIAIETDLLHHGALGVVGEGRLPREHLIESDADTEEIASAIDLIANDLLGAYVPWRADAGAGFGGISQAIVTRDTKVHEL